MWASVSVFHVVSLCSVTFMSSCKTSWLLLAAPLSELFARRSFRIKHRVWPSASPLTLLSLCVCVSAGCGRASRPASQSRSERACLRVPSPTAAGSRWEDSEAAAAVESRRGQDDVGSGGVRTHGDPAAVQRWRQQPLGRRRLGQREQLGSPVRALAHQSPRR